MMGFSSRSALRGRGTTVGGTPRSPDLVGGAFGSEELPLRRVVCIPGCRVTAPERGRVTGVRHELNTKTSPTSRWISHSGTQFG